MSEQQTVSYEKPVLRGTLQVPGDKSISHRAVMLGSIAKGKTTISGFLDGEDCLSTIEMFKQLGVSITRNGTDVTVESPGIADWQTPDKALDAGNSGTTARLMLGILSGSSVTSTMCGDQYLSKRPMKRVTNPLEQMGAKITGEGEADYLPLTITGTPLQPIDYLMPVASAQVKSAVLLAGLQAKGTTAVTEISVSRDHTERMLVQFGAKLEQHDKTIRIKGGQQLTGTDVVVPGDISSAAFFMVAAAVVENSDVSFLKVGLNPTRTGILDVLASMGVHIEQSDEQGFSGERYGTVRIRHSKLQGTEIGGDLIPRLIDELPVLALLATQAEGKTVIKDAEELRVKETDRIEAVAAELRKLGADIETTPDGMIITGPTPLTGAVLQSYGDHRLGMMAAIAGLITSGPVHIENPSCIAISYPRFFEDLSGLVNQ
ncbi:3-phosphoshikimate 1-carboxyvinyltransferase [Sporosarcina sp. P37]|uniref:3-phosphoshikimate 1-carboxyvinyltransferase n=1 Tax=unclassified Sporosarcina TaxID=2647733 RepID=UPI0009C110C4|nr:MULTISPECIES: 3-phosphoshikimate 1-carboxyvinyltransferase [unclassified Sporosarcina]ARD49458.1 3-phosphoshikimate 1-carboxyvinyltransferase [Sporosarcina sp. P33]ARK25934.1 3-phosphoshikimate 1-carboxyvinyltransferase [Sporosarcina sp. P37]PID18246.1 3-phosphoshikimate 1-carboxyvinyltransferase [Sporosarcina sp. P35]